MATGQALLNRMELLDPELQLQSGEADVTRGLLALNIAQDHFESVVASYGDLLGGTYTAVAMTANTEYTPFPAEMLRLDSLWLLDDDSRPYKELENISKVGGHAISQIFPVTFSSSPGVPSGYYTNGTWLLWDRLPDEAHNFRAYGFYSKDDITASGTFGYKDICMLPMATFAVKIISLGLDDGQKDLDSLAAETFNPVIATLSNFNRTGASGFSYRYSHDT